MKRWAVVWLMSAACGWSAAAQTGTAAKTNPGGPPRVLLLVHQQFLPGKAGARQQLQQQTARSFDLLDVPATWIELESLTGPPEALFFDPANSFEDIEKAGTALAQLYGAHMDLAQSQQQIMELVASSRTVTAVRRDDLGYRADSIDLSKARYLVMREVRVAAGQRQQFEEAVKAAQAGASEMRWVVYEVNAGMPEGSYLMFAALTEMKDLDKDFGRSGQGSAGLWLQFPGETNFYAIRPDMSHVSKEFAAGDPGFWVRKTGP